MEPCEVVNALYTLENGQSCCYLSYLLCSRHLKIFQAQPFSLLTVIYLP